MNKPKKFYMFGIGLLIALIVVSASMFVKVHNEKCYWQGQAANNNYSNWSQIHFMTTQIEKIGFTKEAIEEMRLYINGILFATESNLSPHFSSTTTTLFLMHYYDGLALEISNSQKLDDEELQLAIDLFKDATKDLKELSWTILEMAEEPDGKLQLLDADSALYKQAEEMTEEYSEEYSERISNFFSGLEN